jgi:bifunctional non-homologous end joining protein LigD
LQLKTQTSEQGFRGPNFRRIGGLIAALIDRKTNNTAILDGEVAVPDQRGVTHIDNLTMARHAPERLAFFAFDLLWLNGEDLRRPLLERKAKLAKLFRRAPERVVYRDYWHGDGRDLLDTAAPVSP